MAPRQAFDQVLDQLRGYLPQYLTSLGIDCRPGKRFKCINPDHNDHTPNNCGLLKHNPSRGWCFACQTSFDIFDAAAWLEGKPAAGRGWLTDTVIYLANKFGVEIPSTDLSDADLHERHIISAYQHALAVIRGTQFSQMSQKVQDKLQQYRWNLTDTLETLDPNVRREDIRYRLGIGAVHSYDDYMARMRAYGHDDKFLELVDLANKAIFNNTALIFAIRDYDGTCVGFSSRDLNYERRKVEYEALVAKGEEPKFKPRKFFHTREQGTLFHKEQVLLGLDLAKNTTGPIHVFEGNADWATAYAGGLQNSVAILGTAFTRTHLDLLVQLGKKHVVLVLDNDAAGQKATARVMAMADECSGIVGLRVEVVTIPGAKDPDAFIRTFPTLAEGVREFKKLPVVDMFTWRIQQSVTAGEDPYTLAEATLPAIVNEHSNLVRMRQVQQLAQATALNPEFLQRELLRLIDKESMRQDEEKALVASDVAKQLRSDPKNAPMILQTGVQRLQHLDSRNAPFSHESILKTVDLIFDEKEKLDTAFELRTGFLQFDRIFGGIPRQGALFCLPGKPHHGKSIFLDNLVCGMLDKNPELMILLHTIDDFVPMRLERILGAKTGMPSDCFRRPGYYLTGEGRALAPENFGDRYSEAKAWYKGMHQECRLIAADPSMLAGDVMALRTWVQELRRMFPERTMLIIGDNFHLYDMVTEETGEGKVRGISRFISEQIVNTLGTTVMMTMEIPKEQLHPGKRPTYLNLKGSAGLSFDAKVNVGIYNQMQDYSDMPGAQTLTWESAEYQDRVVGSDGIEHIVNRKLPIVEAIVDKNKVSGQKGTVFFRLEDKSGKMTECTSQEQATLKNQLIAIESAKKSAELANSRAPFRRGTV